MDMLRAERLNRIAAAEDAARQLRNYFGKQGADAIQHKLLANAVAQGFQAIREML